jgi:hypothetical protein
MATIDDQIAAYQQLFDALTQAYWDATDISMKDQITSVKDELLDLIQNLDQIKIQAGTEILSQVTAQLTTVNKELKAIKDQITTITKRISTIGQVTAAIDRAISYGTKVVGL